MADRILLVDDDPGMLHFLRFCLRELNPRPGVVVEALDGRQAVRMAEQMPPDVVVMDVMLGKDVTGMEAGREILATSPETRVIFFTGFAEPWIRAEAERLGAFAFLKKGVPMDTICETVARALEARRTEGQPQEPQRHRPGPAILPQQPHLTER